MVVQATRKYPENTLKGFLRSTQIAKYNPPAKDGNKPKIYENTNVVFTTLILKSGLSQLGESIPLGHKTSLTNVTIKPPIGGPISAKSKIIKTKFTIRIIYS